MARANLEIEITDLRRKPAHATVTIELRRDPGTLGAGGGNFDYTATVGDQTIVQLRDIPTRGGAGTLYRISIFAAGYLQSSFQQFVLEGEQCAIQNAFLVRNPKFVSGIKAEYESLPQEFRDWLSKAEMAAPATEDRDLLNLHGEALFTAMGDERRACALNIYAKATHVDTVGPIWQNIGAPMVFRRDRCFVKATDDLLSFVCADERYTSAPAALHEPLPKYRLSNSVKSDDPHANIQFTFQRSTADGSLAVDVDVDEHTGFAHWGEVLRNHFTRQRTNPYVIHQLMLAANLAGKHWDFPLEPGYDLTAKP